MAHERIRDPPEGESRQGTSDHCPRVGTTHLEVP
ncbi:hypothetical protein COLO4_30340 [Corchorus olitorius]|uniref:Uncharacterized protein n=1 Tax=Corchorus olitorius TaxID=93759 RepID=A0A1R3H988_9ROSI|nr:hypothetical protein COLO4_30340 [Corchorus olitorius]